MYGSLPPGTQPNLANPLGQCVGRSGEPVLACPGRTSGNVYKGSQYLPRSLRRHAEVDKDVATREFWPTIANFGIPYNPFSC